MAATPTVGTVTRDEPGAATTAELPRLAELACASIAASPVAREAARACLLDTIACALGALRDPDCARCIGPLVPGATLVCGARVPGTSHALDPAQAAFSLGALIGWQRRCDATFASAWGHPADALGGLLAVADYASLVRLADGRAPYTVGDLALAVLRAHELRRLLGTVRSGGDLRAAVAAGAVVLLDGDASGVQRAWDLGAYGATAPAIAATANPVSPGWRLGEIVAAGVRDALLAVRLGPRADEAPARNAPPVATVTLDGAPAADGVRCVQRLLDAVVEHYPARQAAAIAARLADPAALDALPLNEFVAVLVRN